jgi:hypothetical protein
MMTMRATMTIDTALAAFDDWEGYIKAIDPVAAELAEVEAKRLMNMGNRIFGTWQERGDGLFLDKGKAAT